MNISIYEIIGIWLICKLLNDDLILNDYMIEDFIYGLRSIGVASLPEGPCGPGGPGGPCLLRSLRYMKMINPIDVALISRRRRVNRDN